MENTNLLECRGLSKSYGLLKKNKTPALDNIDLALGSGRIVGLLGPNGSGKTTLLKLIQGLLQPDSGTVSIRGQAIGAASKAETSYLADRLCFQTDMRLSALVRLYADFFSDFNQDRAKTMLSSLGLKLTSRFKSLSKGNKEKVQLVLCMSRQAKVYLLDEPIGGVDPAVRDYIINTIISNYNPEALLLISTHLIQDVEKILDEVIFLKEGKIILQGTADDIRAKHSMSIDELFRSQFKC
jgi:ABC-2 type transport system ATP-binding protein